MQDDAAKRLVSPDASERRAVNVEIETYSRPKYMFRIDKAHFSPEPTVDGALVRFELLQPSEYLLTKDSGIFLKMVRLSSQAERYPSMLPAYSKNLPICLPAIGQDDHFAFCPCNLVF